MCFANAGNETLSRDYMQDTKLDFVVQALSTVAHALRALYLNECLSELEPSSTIASYSASAQAVPLGGNARGAVAGMRTATSREASSAFRDLMSSDAAFEASDRDYADDDARPGRSKSRSESQSRSGKSTSASTTARGEGRGGGRRAGDCPSIVNMRGDRLLAYLMSVNFTQPSISPQNPPQHIFFDASGDPPARCLLLFLQLSIKIIVFGYS